MIFKKKDGTEVVTYTNEERAAALEVSLTSLASYLGFTPVRIGTHYHLKEMDSLVIYNDRTWNRWSGKGSITGGTQIDFMMEYGEATDVPEAILKLLRFKGQGMDVAAPSIDTISQEEKENRILSLPPKNSNYKRLYAYLIQTRGLSQEVVNFFVHEHLIYEDSVHHNIVYCGMDPEGVIRYAGLRGTGDLYGKPFKMDVPGNDKNYGVNIVNKDSPDLNVFESVIDCMSYIDMTGDYTSNKLVLGMVEDNPLAQFLKDYEHIKSISFCLDNDKAGQQAIYGNPEDNKEERRLGLKKKYEAQGYEVKVEIPESGKDFNESLLNSKKNNLNISMPIHRKRGR